MFFLAEPELLSLTAKHLPSWLILNCIEIRQVLLRPRFEQECQTCFWGWTGHRAARLGRFCLYTSGRTPAERSHRPATWHFLWHFFAPILFRHLLAFPLETSNEVLLHIEALVSLRWLNRRLLLRKLQIDFRRKCLFHLVDSGLYRLHCHAVTEAVCVFRI